MSKIGIIPPEVEANLDPFGVIITGLGQAAASFQELGYGVTFLDPTNQRSTVDFLKDDEVEFVYSIRGHGTDWFINDSDGGNVENAFDRFGRTLLTVVANPPYYPGSLRALNSPSKMLIVAVTDKDSLSYADLLNVHGHPIVHLNCAYNSISFDARKAQRPAGERAIPVLYVGSYEDPALFRNAWRSQLVKVPHIQDIVETAAARAIEDESEPVWKVLADEATQRGVALDIRTPASQQILDLISRYATNLLRGRLMATLAQFPAHIVTNRLPETVIPSRHAVIRSPISKAEFLETLHDARALAVANPNRMTGSVSERVPDSLRRGSVVLTPPNSSLDHLIGAGLISYGSGRKHLEAMIDRLVTDPAAYEAPGSAARETAEQFNPLHRARQIVNIVREFRRAPD